MGYESKSSLEKNESLLEEKKSLLEDKISLSEDGECLLKDQVIMIWGQWKQNTRISISALHVI